MQTRFYFLTTALIALLAGGCANGPQGRILTDTLCTAGGALAGRALGKGEALPTAAGAGAGLVLGELAQFAGDAGKEKAFLAGYEKGQGDGARQRYQSLIEQQRGAAVGAAVDGGGAFSLFDVPLPERRVNGVTFAPAKVTLRIAE